MIERLVRESTPYLALLAEFILEQEGAQLSQVDSVLDAIRAVVSSPLWKRIKESQNALAEVPFSIRIEGEEVPAIISGTIDLVFKEHDGWIIVDFKTDKVNGNLQALTDFYRPQVEMYRRFWEEISGEQVKEAGLFFVSTLEWVIT